MTTHHEESWVTTIVTRRLDGDTRYLYFPSEKVTCSQMVTSLSEMDPTEYPLHRTRIVGAEDTTPVGVYVHPPCSLERYVIGERSYSVIEVPWMSPPVRLFVSFLTRKPNQVTPMYVAETMTEEDSAATTRYFAWEVSLYHAMLRVVESSSVLDTGTMAALYHEIQPHLETMIQQRGPKVWSRDNTSVRPKPASSTVPPLTHYVRRGPAQATIKKRVRNPSVVYR